MISIIVPIYNAEKYINRCIKSVLQQTYKEWELILVDDGSKDNSYNICKEYTTNHKNIVAIKQENKGANKARQQGWLQAKGEWVTFIDSDDYIPENALERLIRKSNEETDIIIGMMSTFQIEDEEISIEEYRKRCISGHKTDVGPCAKLYRNKLYNDFIFDIPRELNVGEDNLMNIRLSFRTEKKVCFVKDIVYIYDTTNENSLIHSHRKSLEYENLFHKYRKLSIPNQELNKYIAFSIGNRIYQILQIIKENPFKTDWHNEEFTKELILDIQQNKFPINKSIWLLFYKKSLIVQLLWIIYSKSIEIKHNITKL